MGLDMGFWGSDPAQVGDLLEPELMGIRVLPGDPLFEGKIDQIIETVTFSTVFGVAGQICWKFWKLAGAFGRVSALVLFPFFFNVFFCKKKSPIFSFFCYFS